MLSILRKNAGSWIIKILLGAIVVVFSLWGVGRFRNEERTKVATVNGQNITLAEYGTAFDNLKEQFRQRFGNNLDEDMIKAIGLKKQALNNLIDKKLLLEEASRLSLKVTDDEITEAIMNIGAFQSAGMFNSRLYHNVLSLNHLTPETFEVMQRETMLINKLHSFIVSNAKVSDEELSEFYQWQNASVNIDFVIFDPGQYEGIMPTTQEIEVFYDRNKSKYIIEPQVKVRYLNFESAAYAPKADITEEDITVYYENHVEEFETPKMVDARHILFKVDLDAKPEIVEKVRQRALEIMKMAKEGEDFASLAKKYSEGPTKDVGGELGSFTYESMEKPFSDTAFSMQPGDISEPVRTRYGWHIIKVENVIDASTRSLDEVQADIRETLSLERGKELAYDAAQAVYDNSFEGDDMIKAAEAKSIPVLTTDFFTKRDPDHAIKRRTRFAATAFSLSEMEISDIIDHDDGYYLLQVLEKKSERIPELSEVIDDVRMDLIKEIQDQKAKQEAENFLAALKNGSNLAAESQKRGIIFDSTGLFKRNDPIPKIGYENEISQAAFQLSEAAPIPENVIKGNKGYFVIGFRERTAPSIKEFESQKDTIKKNLLQQKQAKMFDATLAYLRDNSVIEIEEQYFN